MTATQFPAYKVTGLQATKDGPATVAIRPDYPTGTVAHAFVDTVFHASPREAVRLIPALVAGALEADPSDKMRALLLENARCILDALEGVKGHG